MKKAVFLSLFILFSPNVLMAQDFFNPNKGLESKTFDGDGWKAMLKLESKPFWQSKMNIQLIYKGIPAEFSNEQGSLYGSITIRYLDKDGFEVDKQTLYPGTMCAVESQNLICRDDNQIGDNDYRKIVNVSVSNS